MTRSRADEAARPGTPVVADGGRALACRLWQVVWGAFLVEYWVANWFRPVGWGLDAIERGQWFAPHVLTSLATWAVVAIYLIWQACWRRVWPFVPLNRSVSVTLFVAYALWAMASTTYSTIPSLSGVWAIKLMLALGMIGVYVRRFQPAYCWRPAISATVVTLVGALGASVMLTFVSTDDWVLLTSRDALARLGTIDHPVRLGLAAAIAALLMMVWVPGMGPRFLDVLLLRWVVIGLALGIIGLTLSRTGLFVAVIAGVTALILAKRRARLFVGIFPLLVVPLLVSLLWDADALGDMVERYVYRYDRVQTYELTGRFDVWSETANLVLERPWLGYGFVASTRTELAPRLGWWMPAHAHNTWLQAAMDVGIIGAALLVASSLGFTVLAVAGMRAGTGWNRQGGVCGCRIAAAAIILALLTASMHETVFAGTPTVLTVLWLLSGAVVGIGWTCNRDDPKASSV